VGPEGFRPAAVICGGRVTAQRMMAGQVVAGRVAVGGGEGFGPTPTIATDTHGTTRKTARGGRIVTDSLIRTT